MNIEWLLVDSHHSTEAVPPYTAVIWPADGAISIFISEVKKNVYYCLFLSDKQLHKQFNQIKHLYSSPVFQQDTVSSKLILHEELYLIRIPQCSCIATVH